MKKCIYLLALTLLFSLCLPLTASADTDAALSFRYDWASKAFEDSDGNIYTPLDTYHYAVNTGEYLGRWNDEYDLYWVENAGDQQLLLAEDSYGEVQLYCNQRYEEAFRARLSAFTPGNRYGVVNTSRNSTSFDESIHAEAIDTAFIESLYLSKQTVTIPYGNIVSESHYLQVCIFSEDGLFYTPVGLLATFEGSLYYADLRLLEGAEFRYNGQPPITFDSTVQAVKLTDAQVARFYECEEAISEWYDEHFAAQTWSGFFGEEGTLFMDVLMLIVCILLFGLAPLAGMIVGVIVYTRSESYRAFGVGLFILCTLVLAAFCMLLAVFL